jgi:hypothetical protein
MHSPLSRGLPLVATATVLAVLGSLVGVAAPAEAATRTIAVNTTADGDAPGACTDSSVVDAGPTVSLRTALCVADNLGGSTFVAVPTGTFTLSQGAIVVGSNPGTSIEIDGTASALTRIVGGGSERVFTLDESMVGGVDVTISDMTISNGVDNTFGGGAIIAGSGNAAIADSLTLSRTVFDSNSANTNAGGSTANHGGAVQFAGGSLHIANSTFTGNTAGIANGGAVSYQATGTTSGETLSVSATTFTGNTATSSGSNHGAALAVSDPTGGGALSIDRSSFESNTLSGGGAFSGAAVWLDGGSLGVTRTAFTGNVAGTAEASSLAVGSGTITGSYNLFAGNSAPAVGATSGTASSTRSWWGCPGGPGATGCDVAAAGVVTAPYLTLALSAMPAAIVQPAQTATVIATVQDSAGGAVQPSDLAALSAASVVWSTSGVAGATVSPAAGSLGTGAAVTTLTSTGPGLATVSLAAGGAPRSVQVPVYAPPSITSGAVATGVVGIAGSFTVVATGYPVPALSIGGTLPAGVTATDNGDGTLTIAGTPTSAARDYPLTVTATTPGGTASQSLTYSLDAVPSFDSAGAATFTVGAPSTFSVVASGRPTPDPISLTGALPAGVTFTDNHDGTATLGGSPAPGTGGVYSLLLTADNGRGAPAQESFTLTVNEAPAFTSGWSAAVTVGDAATIPITTAHSYPVAAITAGSALPAGLTLTDNHDGTATIAGTPTGSGQTLAVPLTADNGVTAAASGSLTITVRQRPAVTVAAADQRVLVGATASFTAAASGYPAPAVAWSVSTDAGAHWTTLAGETSGTLAFTAARADDGNLYRATFSNAVGEVSTEARLSAGTTPAISSPAGATWVVDGAQHSFSVTTSGLPEATLSTGALPAWLSFTDDGHGAGTLTGTPPAGSGGVYPFTITATNGYQPDATQSFALTIAESPTISSASAVSFSAGVSGSFTTTAAPGYPASVALTVAGALPQGVAFVDAGDGTAVFTGTPAAGTGGVYPLQIAADNGVAPAVAQAFTLTVEEAAVFTSAPRASVARGIEQSIAVTTGHAYPAVTSLTLAGPLPAGLAFVPGPGGTATVTGWTVDPAADVDVVVTASAPGRPDVMQTLTLGVTNVAPVFAPLQPPVGQGPVALPATVVPGVPFTIAVDGFAPDSPVNASVYSVPAQLSLVNADLQGAATMTVTIPAGYTGAHSLVVLGTAPDGSTRVLRTDFTIADASGGSTGSGSVPAAGSGSHGGSGLASTGLDASGLLLLAVALLALGGAALIRRRAKA